MKSFIDFTTRKTIKKICERRNKTKHIETKRIIKKIKFTQNIFYITNLNEAKHLLTKNIQVQSNLVKITILIYAHRAEPMRVRSIRYIGPGRGEPRRGLWISKGPLILNHMRIFWFVLFALVLSTIFSLFRKKIM